jgi:hypothetical protein
LKSVYKFEKKANKIWIVSPDLHFDTAKVEFSNIVRPQYEFGE